MAKHLSLRLPWHDRGWDGHVCDNPTANVFCSGEYGLKAHGIRDKKIAEEEEKEGVRSAPIELLDPRQYRPPCLRTIQTFGGSKKITFLQEPKDFLSTDEVKVQPVPEPIAPFTAGTWPYDRVFRRAEDLEEGLPEEFVDDLVEWMKNHAASRPQQAELLPMA